MLLQDLTPDLPTTEDEASLFSLASEYLEAAKILARTPPTTINVSMVTRYLLGHAAELLLKSLLHKHGVPLEELKRNYRHDILKLVNQAKVVMLVASDELPNVQQLSKTYSEKLMEYRQNRAMEFPSVESLLEEVERLKIKVFNYIFQISGEA